MAVAPRVCRGLLIAALTWIGASVPSRADLFLRTRTTSSSSLNNGRAPTQEITRLHNQFGVLEIRGPARVPGGSTAGTFELKLWRRGGRVRTEIESVGGLLANSVTTIVIHDLSLGKRWHVYPEDRSYSEVSARVWLQAERAAKLGMPMPSPLPSAALRQTEEIQTTNHGQCAVYRAAVEEPGVATSLSFCLAASQPLAELEPLLPLLQDNHSIVFSGLSPGLPGFPLEAVRDAEWIWGDTTGSWHSETRVEEIVLDELPEALFSPPAGFKQRPWSLKWEAKRFMKNLKLR